MRKPRPLFKTRTRAAMLAIAALASCWMGMATGRAQLPRTTITSVFPPGGRSGTSLDVVVKGPTILGVDQLVFSHPGIQAEVKRAKRDEFATEAEPQFGQFHVTIGKDVPPGKYEVRAIGTHGLSNPRCFVVGTVPEIQSSGSNRSPNQPLELPLETIVNGATAGSAIDYFSVELDAGQRVTVACQARSIDSRLNAVLSMIDDRGIELAQAFVVERDPVLLFQAPRAGKYLIAVRDEVYAGGDEYIYRLQVTAKPHIIAAHPLKPPSDHAVELRLLGWNLGASPDPKAAWSWQGQRLESITVQAELLAPDLTLLAPLVPQFPDLVVGTTAAQRFKVANIGTIDLPVPSAPLQPEAQTAGSLEQPQPINIPVEVAGTFYPQADEDWYEFSASAGEQLWIEVVSHRMGSDCDPYLLLQQVDDQDPTKRTDILQVDDPRTRNSTIRGSYAIDSDDPSVLWSVPRDGTYRVMVRDQFGSARRDPRAVYRLIVRPPQPSCRVIAIPQELKTANGNIVPSANLSLRPGETMAVRLIIDRREGFSEDVQIEAVDLPPGVIALPVTVGATDTQAWLVVQASRDVSRYLGPLRLKATSASRAVPIVPACVASGTSNRQLEPARLRPTGELMLYVAPSEPVPVTLAPAVDAPLETSRGGQLKIPVKAVRAKGFDEPITLVPMGLPREITLANATIPKGKSEATMTLAVKNANAKPGVYTFVIRGDTKQKRVLDPVSQASAQATQQRLDGVLKQLTNEVAELKKQVDAAASEVKTAQVALQDAQKQLKASTGKPEEPAAKEKVAAAEKRFAEAQAKQETVQKQYTDTEARRKRAEALKKAADAALANAKKLAAPKDVAFGALSQPIVVRVHQSPLSLTVPETITIAAGGSAEVDASVERKYGFADTIQVQAAIPKGVAGISIPTVKLDKSANQQKVKITVAKNAKPGTYPIKLNASARFNNVPVAASATLQLTVTPNDSDAKQK